MRMEMDSHEASGSAVLGFAGSLAISAAVWAAILKMLF